MSYIFFSPFFLFHPPYLFSLGLPYGTSRQFQASVGPAFLPQPHTGHVPHIPICTPQDGSVPPFFPEPLAMGRTPGGRPGTGQGRGLVLVHTALLLPFSLGSPAHRRSQSGSGAGIEVFWPGSGGQFQLLPLREQRPRLGVDHEQTSGQVARSMAPLSTFLARHGHGLEAIPLIQGMIPG